MTIYNKLKSNSFYEQLQPVEKEINNYLLNNLNILRNLTATKISENCYTTTTSVNRYAQKINNSSFTKLKYDLINEQVRNESSSLLNLSLDDLNFQNFPALEKVFSKSEIYYITGVGASLITARYLHRQLLLLKYQAVLLDDMFILPDLTNINLIVVSSSGESNTMINLLTKSKQNLNKIIAITRDSSTLAKISDSQITHFKNINILNPLEREQQVHMYFLINSLILYLNENN